MAGGTDRDVVPENTKFPLIATVGCLAGNGADPVYVGGVKSPAKDVVARADNGAGPV